VRCRGPVSKQVMNESESLPGPHAHRSHKFPPPGRCPHHTRSDQAQHTLSSSTPNPLNQPTQTHQPKPTKPTNQTGNHADAAAVAALASQLNTEVSLLDAEAWGKEGEKVVTWLALGARGVLNPMASFVGGVVGQEVLKVREDERKGGRENECMCGGWLVVGRL
jgi:hypothetical protein